MLVDMDANISFVRELLVRDEHLGTRASGLRGRGRM